MRDFDQAVTAVTFGWPSVDEYYVASSSRRRIGDVRVPLLVVQAKVRRCRLTLSNTH